MNDPRDRSSPSISTARLGSVVDVLLEIVDEKQLEAVARCYALAWPDERQARLHTVLALSAEIAKIREVSAFAVAIHEAVVEAVIQGDWHQVRRLELDLRAALREAPNVARQREYRDLWAMFVAIAFDACAQATVRAERRERGLDRRAR